MRKRTELEQTIFEAKKVARTALRLKYSILADRELNDALPAIEADIKRAYQLGTGFEFRPSDYFSLEG